MVEQSKAELVVEQAMHGMLETARQQLFFQIHREEPRAGVDCLVAGLVPVQADFLRREMKPVRPSPARSMAQVSGSGRFIRNPACQACV